MWTALALVDVLKLNIDMRAPKLGILEGDEAHQCANMLLPYGEGDENTPSIILLWSSVNSPHEDWQHWSPDHFCSVFDKPTDMHVHQGDASVMNASAWYEDSHIEDDVRAHLVSSIYWAYYRSAGLQ